MYKAFFNLVSNPFDLTSDPRCFVSLRRHNEALAALYHGVRRHKGFVVVTGEVGTGKTLLIRCLLNLLEESDDIAYSYIFNGRLSPFELLEYIASDFRLSPQGKNKCELLLDLNQYLASRGSRGLTTILIVDEAHNLSEDLLEELRLLSNMETVKEKLLQILLLGQPELDHKLDSYALRQLKQRIAHRTHLEALTADETERYIEQRLRIAGAAPDSAQLFSRDAIAAVHTYSKGIPRLINSLCENALITAYARQISCVTSDIIDTAAADLCIIEQCSVAFADGTRPGGSDYLKMGVSPNEVRALGARAIASGPSENE